MRTEIKAIICIAIAIFLNVMGITYVDTMFAGLAIIYTGQGAIEILSERDGEENAD